ncbi:MAG: hypothetical protein KGJ23_08770 [Euryarchaeota archaeon]|nr:hypothetical protein [Euryarchaeota archaeon]MDE1836696.1 hypothetical protein [Euryarchaeota archaeon]MDE1880275.1 hypothetical protein [Euryarchaeota archaeon]MDE2044666.1 hypothetical protein [Thermoplasmata archaeon]
MRRAAQNNYISKRSGHEKKCTNASCGATWTTVGPDEPLKCPRCGVKLKAGAAATGDGKDDEDDDGEEES